MKFLIQNQDEMIKTGHLSEPYKGITDCFARTIEDCIVIVERKYSKCDAVLPNSGPELCIQGLLQEVVQF